MIDIIVEGPEMPESDLFSIVRAIPGVLELLSDAQPRTAVASTVSNAPFGSSSASVSSATPSSASSPTRAAGESRAVAIAEAFPDILDLVNSYRDTIAPDQAPELMFALGVEVAALRTTSFAPVEDSVAINQFATTRLMPDIAGLANAEFSDEGLKV